MPQSRTTGKPMQEPNLLLTIGNHASVMCQFGFCHKFYNNLELLRNIIILQVTSSLMSNQIDSTEKASTGTGSKQQGKDGQLLQAPHTDGTGANLKPKATQNPYMDPPPQAQPQKQASKNKLGEPATIDTVHGAIKNQPPNQPGHITSLDSMDDSEAANFFSSHSIKHTNIEKQETTSEDFLQSEVVDSNLQTEEFDTKESIVMEQVYYRGQNSTPIPGSTSETEQDKMVISKATAASENESKSEIKALAEDGSPDVQPSFIVRRFTFSNNCMIGSTSSADLDKNLRELRNYGDSENFVSVVQA